MLFAGTRWGGGENTTSWPEHLSSKRFYRYCADWAGVTDLKHSLKMLAHSALIDILMPRPMYLYQTTVELEALWRKLGSFFNSPRQ